MNANLKAVFDCLIDKNLLQCLLVNTMLTIFSYLMTSFLAHLSGSDKVSFCDRSSSSVRLLTTDLNDNSS